MINSSSYLIAKDSKGRILLIQRNDVPIWVIPGGHIENGESPKKAAEREFLEETGLIAKAGPLVAKYQSTNKLRHKYLYFALSFRGEIIKNIEARQIGWFYPGKLPHPITLYERKKIYDTLSYKNKTILREDIISIRKEIMNQLIRPHIFLYLLLSYLKHYFFGSKSFKLK